MKPLCQNIMYIRRSIGLEDNDEPVGLITDTCEEVACSREQIASCMQEVSKTKYQLQEEGQRICQSNNGLDTHTLEAISSFNREYANKMFYLAIQGKTDQTKEKLIAYAMGNLKEILNNL